MIQMSFTFSLLFVKEQVFPYARTMLLYIIKGMFICSQLN
jgi:hypothetical protein